MSVFIKATFVKFDVTNITRSNDMSLCHNTVLGEMTQRHSWWLINSWRYDDDDGDDANVTIDTCCNKHLQIDIWYHTPLCTMPFRKVFPVLLRQCQCALLAFPLLYPGNSWYNMLIIQGLSKPLTDPLSSCHPTPQPFNGSSEPFCQT